MTWQKKNLPLNGPGSHSRQEEKTLLLYLSQLNFYQTEPPTGKVSARDAGTAPDASPGNERDEG